MTCACGNSYIVQSGDTLFLIAEQQLGDGNRWRELMNPDCTTVNDTNIFPGQELCIPNGSTTPPPKPGKELDLEATFYASENVGCNFTATEVFGVTLGAALAGRFEGRCPGVGENIPRIQCATDPNVIPRLTNFTLVWNGTQLRAAALDVGTAIIGMKIDILVDTVEEAINLGRKPIKIIL